MSHTQQLELSMLNLRGMGIGAGVAKRRLLISRGTGMILGDNMAVSADRVRIHKEAMRRHPVEMSAYFLTHT